MCRTVPRTARYGTARYGHLGKWPYWWPVPRGTSYLCLCRSQLLGNRTKWPYWPVRFASKPTKVFRPYHALVRRVISIVHESTNHSRLADPYLGMNGGPLCLLEPPPGRHRYTLRGAPAEKCQGWCVLRSVSALPGPDEPRPSETNAMELGEGDHRAKWREQGVFRDPH